MLSPIVARLLTLLLEERGKVLTREELMHRVWELHGLEPSGNSLNQYISQLRRNFQNLGLPGNTIKTLPRVGFLFNGEINVRVLEESDEDAVIAEPMPEVVKGKVVHRPVFIPKQKPRKARWIAALLLLLLVASPFVVKAVIERVQDAQLATSPLFIGKVNGCEIQGVQMGKAAASPGILARAEKLMAAKNITCKPDSVVLFYTQDSVLHDRNGGCFSPCVNGKVKS